MRKLLIISLLFLSASQVLSQVYTPMTAAGYGYKRIKVDSTLHIPTFCGTPNLRSTTTQKQAAIALDSCNHKFYFYDPKRLTWDTITGGASLTTIINNITIDSIREGETNLYFTTQRVRGSLYGAAPILYDSATGTFSLDTFSVTGVATKHDLEKIDTAVISVTAYQSGDSIIILVEKKGGGTNRIYLVAPPLPAHTHPASDIISGILPIVRGGTGIGIIGLTGQSIRVNPAGTGLEYYTPAAGNSGTITNIATTGPITGGPITSTGTIGFDTTNHHTKQFYDGIYGSLSGQNTNTSNIATNTSNIALKVNISDTSNMLLPYRNAINTNTANITANTSNISTNTTNIALKLNKSDTAAMLLNYKNAINANTANITTNTNNIALKQNLVTLTTSGTTGASTFNQGTGALNIPSYTGGGMDSVRKTIGSDTVKQFSAGTGTFAFRQQRVFNVRDYGADNTGVSDATVQIQAAINAAGAAYGGTVYFPNGTYLINGAIQTSIGGYDPNSQLYIPLEVTNNYRARYHIKLLGESPPNHTIMGLNTTTLYPTSGVILKSGYIGTRSQTVAGTAIIGGNGANLGGVGNGENLNYLTVENISFVAKNNPNGNGPEIGGVQGRHMASINIINCVYTVDTSGNNTTMPIEPISGFETSDCNNEIQNNLKNSSAFAVRYGFVIGEHTSADQIQSNLCYYGIVGKAGNHASNISRALVQSSRYALGYYNNGSGCQASNLCPLNISLLDVEWNPGATQWFKSIYCVNDSLNGIYGNIRYWVSVTGVGGNGNASWVVNGATNLKQSALGTNPLGMSIGGSVTSGTAGSVIYLGPAGVLAQDNANFFWDGTNHRLGLGTTTPTADLQITGANPAHVFTTTGANGQVNLTFQKQGVNKWRTIMDLSGIGKADYSIYDSKNSKAVLYADSSGNLNLGGTASAPGTAAIAINSSNNVTVNNGLTTTGGLTANNVLTANYNVVINTSAASTDAISFTGSNAGRVSIVGQNTNSAGGTSLYFQNNRGSFASYGGVVHGGSTFAGLWFGASRSDKTYLIADGANNLGMGIGTLVNQDVVFGSNNAERMRITAAGGLTFPATNTAVGTTGARTINQTAGSVNFAAAANTLVVTNSLVTTASLVFLQVYGTDATAKSATVTIAAGSFTITLNAAATAETKVAWHVIN